MDLAGRVCLWTGVKGEAGEHGSGVPAKSTERQNTESSRSIPGQVLRVGVISLLPNDTKPPSVTARWAGTHGNRWPDV